MVHALPTQYPITNLNQQPQQKSLVDWDELKDLHNPLLDIDNKQSSLVDWDELKDLNNPDLLDDNQQSLVDWDELKDLNNPDLFDDNQQSLVDWDEIKDLNNPELLEDNLKSFVDWTDLHNTLENNANQNEDILSKLKHVEEKINKFWSDLAEQAGEEEVHIYDEKPEVSEISTLGNFQKDHFLTHKKSKQYSENWWNALALKAGNKKVHILRESFSDAWWKNLAMEAGNKEVNIAEESVSLVSKFADVSSSFKSLKSIKGHYDGGIWDDRVDTYNGEKHELMLRLDQELLSLKSLSLSEFHEIMGKPDVLKSFEDISLGEEVGPQDMGKECVLNSIKIQGIEEGVIHPMSSEEGVIHPMGIEEGVIHPMSSEEGVIHPMSSEEGVIHPMGFERSVKHLLKDNKNTIVECGSSYFEIYFWRGYHDYIWVFNIEMLSRNLNLTNIPVDVLKAITDKLDFKSLIHLKQTSRYFSDTFHDSKDGFNQYQLLEILKSKKIKPEFKTKLRFVKYINFNSSKTKFNQELFFHVTKLGHLESIKVLINKGILPTKETLKLAVIHNHVDIVREFLFLSSTTLKNVFFNSFDNLAGKTQHEIFLLELENLNHKKTLIEFSIKYSYLDMLKIFSQEEDFQFLEILSTIYVNKIENREILSFLLNFYDNIRVEESLINEEVLRETMSDRNFGKLILSDGRFDPSSLLNEEDKDEDGFHFHNDSMDLILSDARVAI
ncbi:hypothetical protein HDU92_005064 [Lobulomyces angularis]|nr:hypothetical protein HDU92_005064 [Lobulomyces angularis]